MHNQQPKGRRIRVTHAEDQPLPEEIRKISRAIIALARAQLEAEAEAEHRAKPAGRKPPTGPEPKDSAA